MHPPIASYRDYAPSFRLKVYNTISKSNVLYVWYAYIVHCILNYDNNFKNLTSIWPSCFNPLNYSCLLILS